MASIQILEISSTLTEEGKELSKKDLSQLEGTFDLINLNGSLTKINNSKNKDKSIKVCYVGGISGDTRTYKQMDSLEVYVLYHLLQDPYLFITNASTFGGNECSFDVGKWLKEIGVNKRHYLTQAKL